MIKYLLANAVLALGISAQASLTLHVSPAGADANPGTRLQPFSRLSRARDEIRSLRKTGKFPAGGVIVQLAPGRYSLPSPLTLAKDDSGAEGAPVIYRAATRGTSVLSGGVVMRQWKAVTDPAVLRQVAPALRGKLLVADLGAEFPEALPGFANGGCGFRGKKEYPLALYQDGKRLPVSRWPEEGFVMTGDCLGESIPAGHMGIRYTEGRFVFKNARLKTWRTEPELWLDGLWFVPWADSKMQLKGINLKEQSISLLNPEDSGYGYMPNRHFFVFNAICEISRPGEWAVDRKQRKLYLLPAADPATKPVVVALGKNLLVAENVSHVRFEDLVFQDSQQEAILIKNSRAVTISGSTLRHTGSWGIDISGGADCQVVGCDLYDIGEGGIKATGGVKETLTPGNHLIENNHIHHFGQFVNTYRPGAAVYGVGNKIRHNLIHHAQHQAVFFQGNNHLIENNIIHDVCLHTSDAGAVYACARDWSQRGTVIRNNLIHTTGKGVDGCGSHGIYMDDSTSGTTIERNIVVAVDTGITSCGLDNRVENNIAINTRKASFQISSRGVDSFAKKNAAKGRESSLFRKILREEKLYRSELWRKAYPNLLAILDMDPIEAHDSHFNILRNNANVGGVPASVRNSKKIMRTSTIQKNLNFYDVSDFVDLASFDLRLRKDSRIRRRIPGFKEPDFPKMGLYSDSRRASKAIKFGEGVSPMPVIQPRIPQPERNPRYILELLDGKPLEVDGKADEKEWPKTRNPQLECGNKIYKEPSKFDCLSRAGFDGENLRFLIVTEVDSEKELVSQGKWGARDGIELAFSDLGEDAPVILFHAYPDGTVEIDSNSAGDTVGTIVGQLRKETLCAASVEKGKWTLELSIPVSAFALQAEAFQQIRFNMNVRRLCDNTWTCWWPPENGIKDLLSSGLLILPRKLPETAEMTRRREAAAALFAAEKNKTLGWQQIKNWKQFTDPDCLGPNAKDQLGEKANFQSYAGWAVARASLSLSEEQLAKPFCSLFLPCVDEEGDVYLNGRLFFSHTAAATGIAPGKLWRQPFLVNLKGLKPGTVELAVHFRGNLGSGGLRKGAFLVFGETAYSAEQVYDFLADNPKLGWRDRIPKFWQDLERERIPELPAVADEAEFGKRIQRTMGLLATSTREKRNRVRILFYGQSITQGMHSLEMINTLRQRFPWAIIDFENRAIGGFGADSLVRVGEHDLYPRDADLLIFHVYGGFAPLDTLFANVRQRNSSEILVYTHHYNWVDSPDGLASRLHSLKRSVADWHKLAETYQMELAPVWRDWPLFFRKHDWGINEVMGDTVHSNVHHNAKGHVLLAKLVLRNFRYHPEVAAANRFLRIDLPAAAISTTGDWKEEKGGLRTSAQGASLKLTFNGNRVDLLPLPSSRPGSASIRIDGKSPREFRQLYYCTRPSQGPYIWMPAIKRVDLGEGVLPRIENWTLTPTQVDLKKKTLSYRLEGSITGPDGNGDKTADFLSNSGRIKLSPKDFNIIWPCTYRKKDELPEDYKVTWEILPLFQDPWRVPANSDPAQERPITLVKGLDNGPHTLEIIANGDGEIPIKAIMVRQPPQSGKTP